LLTISGDAPVKVLHTSCAKSTAVAVKHSICDMVRLVVPTCLPRRQIADYRHRNDGIVTKNYSHEHESNFDEDDNDRRIVTILAISPCCIQEDDSVFIAASFRKRVSFSAFAGGSTVVSPYWRVFHVERCGSGVPEFPSS
jgi:hypothetical protein